MNEEFEEIQERLDQLDKDNRELESQRHDGPHRRGRIHRTKNERKLRSFRARKNKKASQQQQQAADEMQQMAEQMESMMQQQSEESLEIDMDALRALLENIIDLSFDEEG